jgi:hypothetical protein
VYVWDAAGNKDFCNAAVVIEANGQGVNCGDDPLVNLGGAIADETNKSVENVKVALSGQSSGAALTTINGTYNFANVPAGNDVTITPEKDDNPLNGVTTFDLVLISKHILGVQSLGSAYKVIAADANKSNGVTTADLVELRKLILQVIPNFSNNTSWRFVDKKFVFPNPAKPFDTQFPEVVSINNITSDQLAADFVAVKTGDVNGNAQPSLVGGNEDRNATGTLAFAIDDKKLVAGEEYTVEFKAQGFDVLGYQFTLNFDRSALEFVQVNPAIAGTENFGLTMLDKGAITTSWNDNNTRLNNGEVVFSLVFKATKEVSLSEALNVNSRYTQAEAYQRNGELLDVQLAFNGNKVAVGFELYQNTPNPFSTSTIVGFNLPEAATATLTITDVSGRLVKMVNGDFAKGYNEIRLERRDLPVTGILYYQLDTPMNSATKMMLLID